MRKIIIILLSGTLLFSSCASVFNERYQEVDIQTDPESEIMVNGKGAWKHNGLYRLKRDRMPKQLTIKKEGYKDRHVTIMPYKKSPWYIMSWVPFGVLLFPPLYDNGVKAFDYESEIKIDQTTVEIPRRDESAKEIELNRIGTDLKAHNIKHRYFPTYRYYKKYADSKIPQNADGSKKIEAENTIFSDLLNEIMKEKGYIDTADKVLKNSYLDNLFIDATVQNYTYHHVQNCKYPKFGGMIYVDLEMKWEVLDYYKDPIYQYTTKTTSGEFAILDYDEIEDPLGNAIKDAMEYGLIELMNSNKMAELMNDRSRKEIEKAFDKIHISKPDSYVSNLNEALESSVTIKNDEGHGSGFVVSENGHIITNYHVVSDTTDLKVVMKNKSEYEVELIRVSKIADLALLKIDTTGVKPFKLRRDQEIKIANDIYAVGTPSAEDLSQTVSKGIISGVRERSDNSQLIQTDASINSGNSGGAIVNKQGEVLGVVSSKLKGFGIEGVAFGIPAYEIFKRLNISMMQDQPERHE